MEAVGELEDAPVVHDLAVSARTVAGRPGHGDLPALRRVLLPAGRDAAGRPLTAMVYRPNFCSPNDVSPAGTGCCGSSVTVACRATPR